MSAMNWFRRRWVGRRKNWVTVDSVGDLKEMMPPPVRRMLTVSGLKSIRSSEVLDSFRSGQPVWKDWSTEKAVQEGYKISTWVYACVFRKSSAAASVPWRAEEKVAGQWQPIETEVHPVEALLEKPNKFWSRQDLIERASMHLNLGGDAFMTKVRSPKSGPPTELWLVAPDKMSPVPDPKKFLSHYDAIKDGHVYKKIRPQDCIHFMFTDPANEYRGIAPLQAAARTVDTDNAAVDWQKLSMDNRAVMDGVLASKEPLSDDQFEVALERFREQHKGSDNAHGPLILSGDWSWHNFSFNPVEMDFVRSRGFSAPEICAAFGVLPPVIGILDDATLANIETSWIMFWLGTIIPFLEAFRDLLNLQLTPEFGDDDVRLNFDISKVAALRELFRKDVDTGFKLWQMGVPFNRINSRLSLGFSEFEGWEKSYVPVNMIPAENAGLIGSNLQNISVEDAKNVLQMRAQSLLNGRGQVVSDAIEQLAVHLIETE